MIIFFVLIAEGSERQVKKHKVRYINGFGCEGSTFEIQKQ